MPLPAAGSATITAVCRCRERGSRRCASMVGRSYPTTITTTHAPSPPPLIVVPLDVLPSPNDAADRGAGAGRPDGPKALVIAAAVVAAAAVVRRHIGGNLGGSASSRCCCCCCCCCCTASTVIAAATSCGHGRGGGPTTTRPTEGGPIVLVKSPGVHIERRLVVVGPGPLLGLVVVAAATRSTSTSTALLGRSAARTGIVIATYMYGSHVP